MRFLKYNEKILLLVLSLLLIGVVTITIYFNMNYEQFMDKNSKVAILTSEEFDKNIEKLAKIKNIEIYSSNNYDKNPNNIVKELEKIYYEYSLFIIVMENTRIPVMASYLGFMLENLSKPVIFTENSNLMKLVNKTDSIAIPEVIVYDGKQLLRGVTTQLNEANEVVSYKYPPLNNINCLEFPNEKTNFKYIDPKIRIDYGKNNKNSGGIIFDIKNIPSFDTLKKLKKPHIIISENSIKDIKTYNMTRESAYCKLSFLLSNIKEKDIVSKLLDINFRGELIIL